MVYWWHIQSGTSPAPRKTFSKEAQTMKLLKALLAVLTTLAVSLTVVLLLWQDKNAPRYIQIYTDEQ